MIFFDTPSVVPVSPLPATAIASEVGSWSVIPGHAAPPPSAAPSESSQNDFVTYVAKESEWTEALQAQFNALVRAKALRRISPQQLTELNQLQSQRRLLLDPPTVDEVLDQYTHQAAEDALITALRAYVRLRPSNH